jgi:hypothetical protein
LLIAFCIFIIRFFFIFFSKSEPVIPNQQESHQKTTQKRTESEHVGPVRPPRTISNETKDVRNHKRMDKDFEHLGKYFPQWLGGMAMTAAEQGAMDKLSDINGVLGFVFSFVLLLFVFFAHRHIDKIMGDDICIQCNSEVIPIKNGDDGYDKKCVNPNCAIYYVFVSCLSMYDIDRFRIKGRNEIQNDINNPVVQVF